MQRSRRILVLFVSLGVALPALALSEPPPAEDPQTTLEKNRRLLEGWKQQEPGHYARLKRDHDAFRGLPADRQARMRQLDHDLHAEDPATQARLLRVLDRYAAWLDRLPTGDRAWIADSPDSAERLKRVQAVRDRQWVERLPRQVQADLQKLPPDQRAEEVAKLRQKDRERRLEWFWAGHPRGESSLRRVRPTRLSELPQEVQFYYVQALARVLTFEERQRLAEAEGHWPQFARTLGELAERHPFILPGWPGTKWPTHYAELPKEARDKLPVRNVKAEGIRLKNVAGKWPDFALTFTEVARQKKIDLTVQLGPSRPKDFAPPVKQFLENRLLPQLTPAEKKELEEAEGKWPEYPRLLLDVARKHDVQIPGLHQPGPREFWDALRNALPDVPDATLREFAQAELTPEDQAAIKPGDPSSRDRLIAEYFKRHPEQLKRQLRSARQAAKPKPAGPGE